MIAFDTNIIIRFLINDQPEQAQAVSHLIQSSPARSIYVDNVVLMEAVWVLTGPRLAYPRPLIAQMINALAAIDQFDCDRQVWQDAARRYEIQKSLSFTDCYLLAAMKQQSMHLYTFDQKLAKQSQGLAKLLEISN